MRTAHLGLAATAATCVMSAPASAQHTIHFDRVSRIVIEGTSNVHRWSCATTKFDATAEAPDASATELGKALTSLSVTIPVASIDCGHGDMNKNLQNAMHADKHPTIGYRMTSYDATPSAGSYEIVMHGVLTINGVDRPTDVKATVTPTGSGGASAVGSAAINTTDFGVKPVSVLLGTLRTSPQVTITLRMTGTRS